VAESLIVLCAFHASRQLGSRLSRRRPGAHSRPDQPKHCLFPAPDPRPPHLAIPDFAPRPARRPRHPILTGGTTPWVTPSERKSGGSFRAVPARGRFPCLSSQHGAARVTAGDPGIDKKGVDRPPRDAELVTEKTVAAVPTGLWCISNYAPSSFVECILTASTLVVSPLLLVVLIVTLSSTLTLQFVSVKTLPVAVLRPLRGVRRLA